ncbi:hypothetical protein JVT61DRAFT_10374 [Boletus reticuloceps]|uniref:HNH nuclease domain-containing protein n=1 Tax=Boletus reticuloceps TaxID=495285 RepID=A0A8I2YWM4_9AGAM|nr:hypothetical protein JVT61DRAFT_10374 [Boletus reticuloceps]
MIKTNPSGVRRNPPHKCKSQNPPLVQKYRGVQHMLGGALLSSDCHLDGQHKVAQELDHAAESTASTTVPHSGQCLLTNLNEAVEVCHLIARSTKPTTLRRLAYAWGLCHEQLHLDTCHNLFFCELREIFVVSSNLADFVLVRVDWCHLFDQNKLILVPEHEILEMLHKFTITQAPEDRFQTFGSGAFKYNLVPLRELQTPIYRFEGSRADGVLKLTTHKYPYNTLTSLSSHVKLQYVVFNSGRKLRSFSYAQLLELVAGLRQKDILPSLLLIIKLYQRWTTLGVSSDFESPESDDEDDIQSISTSESTGSSCIDDSWVSSEETSWMQLATTLGRLGR